MPELEAREPHAAERLLDLYGDRLKAAGVNGYIMFASWDDIEGGKPRYQVYIHGDEIWLRGATSLIGDAIDAEICEAHCPRDEGEDAE